MMKNNIGRITLRVNFIKQIKRIFTVSVISLLLSGCFQGTPSDKPAIHLNPNMDDQQRYDPQEKSPFFADGRASRTTVEGTVARGEYYEDDAYALGKDNRGNFVDRIPMKLTPEMMKRGQERYNIYCSPCHSKAGDGKGIVVKRGFLPPPSFHQDKVRAFKDGYIFDVISKGVRNMPAYRKQIPIADRWAIIAYVRALQRTQNATIKDVPKDKLNGLN